MGEMTFDQPTPESPPTNPPASAAPAPEGPPSVSTPVSSEAETPSPYGETLLTRADRSPEKAPPPPEPKPTDPEPEAATVPDGPDGYQLAFAPETSVDQELLGDFRKTAHGLGLTQEQAKLPFDGAALLAMFHGNHWDLSYDTFPWYTTLGSTKLKQPFAREPAMSSMCCSMRMSSKPKALVC